MTRFLMKNTIFIILMVGSYTFDGEDFDFFDDVRKKILSILAN